MLFIYWSFLLYTPASSTFYTYHTCLILLLYSPESFSYYTHLVPSLAIHRVLTSSLTIFTCIFSSWGIPLFFPHFLCLVSWRDVSLCCWFHWLQILRSILHCSSCIILLFICFLNFFYHHHYLQVSVSQWITCWPLMLIQTVSYNANSLAIINNHKHHNIARINPFMQHCLSRQKLRFMAEQYTYAYKQVLMQNSIHCTSANDIYRMYMK